MHVSFNTVPSQIHRKVNKGFPAFPFLYRLACLWSIVLCEEGLAVVIYLVTFKNNGQLFIFN